MNPEQILKTLDAYGFEWDGEVLYQSRCSDLYRAAFDELNAKGSIFPCACTRKQLAGAEQELRDAVAAARDAGDSWAAIGAALDTTRQNAFQRFGRA